MFSQTQDFQREANKHYVSRFDDEMRELVKLASDGDGEALEQLYEMPLSFQKTITYHQRESIEWEILLGTGGPADRVVVQTDFDGTIEDARYEFQDWFQPWTSAEDQDEDLVRAFAEIVGYYEDQS